MAFLGTTLVERRVAKQHPRRRPVSLRHRFLAVCWMLALPALTRPGSPPIDPDRPPPPLSPAEAEKKFQVADGLTIRLAASEPEVTQPLSISFDDRGRMWVLQYRQ